MADDEQNVTADNKDAWEQISDFLNDTIRWTDKYSEKFEKFYHKVPDYISTFVSTLAIIVFGAALKSEWVIISVTAFRQWSGRYKEVNTTSVRDLFSSEVNMDGWLYFYISSLIVSFIIYFSVGGILHWYFYVRRRHLAHEWKIQSKKWLSPELEKDAIMSGCIALVCTNFVSATFACYIYNENPSTLYYGYDDYGWPWFFAQFIVIFLFHDYCAYVLHRMYHWPFLYKRFHKLHHRYKYPTAFSATALHPVEMIHMQLVFCIPLFTMPVHWIPFYTSAFYSYYHGLLDHSGINFKAQWWQPWQPDAIFHDKHHELFHVNFGFNMACWDKLHGTDIKENKVYNEETFHDMPQIPLKTNNKEDNKQK